MGNYKPYGHPAFVLEGIYLPIPADATPMTLTQNNSATTTGLSFHTEANLTYQVPTGKTFTLIGSFFQHGTASKIMTIEQSDDEDASTNPVIKFACFMQLGTHPHWIPHLSKPTILSEKYINFKVDAATNAGRIVAIIGYET